MQDDMRTAIDAIVRRRGKADDKVGDIMAEFEAVFAPSVIHIAGRHVPLTWIEYGGVIVGVDANGRASEIRFDADTRIGEMEWG